MAESHNKNGKAQTVNIFGLLRVIGIAVLIVLVIVAVTLAIDSRINLSSSSKNSGETVNFDIGAAAIESLYPYPNGVVALADSAVYYFDTHGNTLSVNEHSLSSPAVQVNGKNLVLYDLGGKKLRIEKRGGVYSDLELDGIITSAAIGKKGNYAYSLNSHGGFQSHLFVFSAIGKKTFEWGSSSEYISCLSLSDNGRYCAASLLSAENAQPVSYVKLFSFTSDKPLLSVPFPGTVIYDIVFTSSKKLTVFSSDGVFTLDLSGNAVSALQYSAFEAKHYSNCPSGLKALSLAVFGNDKNSKICVFGKRGKMLFEKSFDGEIVGISSGKNGVTVILHDKIEVYDSRGNAVGSIDIQKTCKKAVALGNRVFMLNESGLFASNA